MTDGGSAMVMSARPAAMRARGRYRAGEEADARRERAPTWRRESGRAVPGVLVLVLPAGVMALVPVRLTMPLLPLLQVRGPC